MRQLALIVAVLVMAANCAEQRNKYYCDKFLLSSSDDGYFGNRYMEAWGKYELQNDTYVQKHGYVMKWNMVVSAH